MGSRPQPRPSIRHDPGAVGRRFPSHARRSGTREPPSRGGSEPELDYPSSVPLVTGPSSSHWLPRSADGQHVPGPGQESRSGSSESPVTRGSKVLQIELWWFWTSLTWNPNVLQLQVHRVDSALACFSCCWKCEFVDCCLQQSHILEWPAGRLRFVSFGPRSTMGVSTWIPPTASRSFRHSSVEPPRGCHAALRSCSLMWTDRSVLRCYIGNSWTLLRPPSLFLPLRPIYVTLRLRNPTRS